MMTQQRLKKRRRSKIGMSQSDRWWKTRTNRRDSPTGVDLSGRIITLESSMEVSEAMITVDLSTYAGKSWARGELGEVFAEAFRVWQEGGESRITAILGPMIDAALKGAI